MDNTNTRGPAFPSHGSMGEVTHQGMTLRQYAAIKLRVPESGLDWLDAMIERANRDAFAGQALMGFAAAGRQATPKEWGETCYSLADAMLAAREAKQ